MMLLYEPKGALGQIRRGEAEGIVSAHLHAMGLGSVNPRAEVRDLDLAVRQKLEIARAIFRKPRILLLDKPTSTLSGPDIAWLGKIIADAKASGVSVIFISHRMPEVQEFCEYLTVFRNGRDIGSGRVDEMSEEQVVRMIIGRSLTATFPPKEDTADHAAPPALEARVLSAGCKLKRASFKLAPAEILGIAGLQGMGQLDLFLACFGATELSEGEILVHGRPATLASPRDAIAASIGIGFVPEERKTEGLFLKLSGRDNISLPVAARFSRFGLIEADRENQAVAQALDALRVDRRALYTRAGSFSGGNQQKIAIAKWLLAGSRILLLYDPTRGVDIGTKHEIYVLIRNFVRDGGSILMFSTEIPELVNLCNRVLVMYDGRIACEIDGASVTEEAIMHAALGGSGELRERGHDR